MRVKVDADLINSRVNHHGKCRPATCRSKRKGCTTCRFGVLKRDSDCTRCSDLVSSTQDPAKVEARTTINPPPRQDERWPLTPDDPRTLAVDLRRRTEVDRMQIEASHIVTSALRCNTNHQLLGTEEQARSAGYYAVKYCVKDPQGQHHCTGSPHDE